MRRIQSAASSLTLVACLGMLFPPAVLGDGPVARTANQRVVDVSLHDGGLLVGQVVSPEGKTLKSVNVALASEGKELARTSTDEMGRFAVKGLSGGVYQLASPGAQLFVRAWSKQNAPPKTAIGALLVAGTTVRGQCNCNSGHGHAGHTGGGYASYGAGSGYGSAGYGQAASFNQGGSGGAASFNQGSHSFNHQGGTTSYGQQEYGTSTQGGNYGTSVLNNGDAGYHSTSGSNVYSTGDTASVVTSGETGAVSPGNSGFVSGDPSVVSNSGVVPSADAGVTYGGTGGYYDGSAAVNGASSGYVESGAYAGSYSGGAAGGYGAGYGGSGAAGGFGYGGGTAASSGGGLLGSGGIFGGAGVLSSPWVIGAGVAAAVAVPVALDDDDAS